MGQLEGWCFSTQVIVMLDGFMLSWGWLNSCLGMGRVQQICLCAQHLFNLLNCLYLNECCLQQNNFFSSMLFLGFFPNYLTFYYGFFNFIK